jgi:hypothetical protein
LHFPAPRPPRANGNSFADLLHGVFLVFFVLVLSPLWRAVLVLVIEKDPWPFSLPFYCRANEQ